MNPVWVAELLTGSIHSLMRHKLRSLLTLLGVLFGVAAVITMLGIGEGAQQTVLRDIAGLGLRNMIIDSVPPSKGETASSSEGHRGPQLLQYGLTRHDVDQLRSILGDANLTVAHAVQARVYQQGKRVDAQVLGVAPEYFEFFDTRLIQGRLFGPLDELHARRVALVTSPLAALAQQRVDALRPVVKIGTDYFDVVGVIHLPSRQGTPLVLLPYRTAYTIFGTQSIRREAGSVEFTRQEVGQIVIQVAKESDIPATARAMERTIQSNHNRGDYRTTVPLELLKARQRTQRVLNLVLTAIASISLLVGGIGIMNIMLAVVTERIPEIGVRRALGATRRDILWQFLAETVTLSSLGGLLGCLFGMMTVPLASRWTGWEGVITPSSVIVSLLVSWVVGLVFGMAPALRAARMDPVDALRYQ